MGSGLPFATLNGKISVIEERLLGSFVHCITIGQSRLGSGRTIWPGWRETKEVQMLKSFIAILIGTTIPASAADNVISRHEVSFEGQTFICGKIEDRGDVRRFIHSIPQAKYIPEFEPSANDPLARSWLITYRIICEGGYHRSNLASHGGRKRY